LDVCKKKKREDFRNDRSKTCFHFLGKEETRMRGESGKRREGIQLER